MAGGVKYTFDEYFLPNVTRRCALGTNQLLVTTDDIQAYCGDELSSTIMPIVHSAEQEHWVETIDVPLVANQLNYALPIRGVCNGLRYISLLDAQGNEYNFPKLRPEQIIGSYSWVAPYATAALFGFYFEGSNLVVFPESLITNPVDISIRFRFERQPNQLCSITEAGQVTNINLGTNTLTLTFVPTDWAIGDTLDVTESTMPFDSHGDDLVITALNAMVGTVTVNAIPTTVVINDWVSLSGTSPVAQIPFQLYPLLVQAVVCRVLASQADLNPYEREAARLEKMRQDQLILLQPRDVGNTDTVINKDNFMGSGGGAGYNGSYGVY